MKANRLDEYKKENSIIIHNSNYKDILLIWKNFLINDKKERLEFLTSKDLKYILKYFKFLYLVTKYLYYN